MPTYNIINDSILERIDTIEKKLKILLEVKEPQYHQPIRLYPDTYHITNANMKDANGRELYYVEIKKSNYSEVNKST